MKHSAFVLVVSLALVTHRSAAQQVDADLFFGIANYQGDLQSAFFTFLQSRTAAGVLVKYGFSKNLYLLTGLSIGALACDDAATQTKLTSRNLRFQTHIQEVQLGGEYRFIKADNFPATPYVFAGIGAFHFNPYTYYHNNKVYLQPLGTEGQGLVQYPQKQFYRLTQFCLMYGLGIKYRINCNINVGLEFGHRKLFTDYLDDVSGSFADENILRNARGQQAVDLAFPTRLIDPTAQYPKAGSLRANPKQKDWYYLAGITLGLKFTDCQTGVFSLGGLLNRKKRRNAQLLCPANVY